MDSGILKLAEHDEAREIEFELRYLRRLTREQRVALVLERSRLLLDMLAQRGHAIVPGIVKRVGEELTDLTALQDSP